MHAGIASESESPYFEELQYLRQRVAELEKFEERLNNQQLWLQSVLDLMPTPLLFIEPGTASILFANQAADQLAGGEFPRARTAEEHQSAFFCTDAEGHRIPEQDLPGVRVARGERLRQYYMDWHLSDGKRSLLLSADVLPAMYGQPAICVMILQDVTKLKQIETALRRSNEDLKQFTYAASHDLQEPLRMISSYSDLISRRYRSYLDDAADQYIGYLVEGASRMQALLRSILEYSQAGDCAPLNQEWVSGTLAVEKALENLRLSIEESGAVIQADELPVVPASEAHLVQVFQNLIGNAIKYRREGVPPQVHLSVEANEVEWVFAVRDNGIGIAPRYFRRIFGIFKRLHGRKYPGTGIGLSICSKLIEGYGGRIWLDSEEGKGSVFFFSLPLQRSLSSDQ